MMKTVKELGIKDLEGKSVLLRVDFNVPFENGKPTESYKIKAHKETINFLSENGANILLVSHHGEDGFSFKNYLGEIEKILGQNLFFFENLNSVSFESGRLALLDNIRNYGGEEKNDKEFTQKLSENFDIFVNDAFSVCHRDHASVTGVAAILPSYAGFLIIKETDNLKKAIEYPPQGKTLIIGGGKVGTKAPLVENFINKADKILIGGAVANNFFKAKGIKIGKSVFDAGFVDQLKPLIGKPTIILPQDIIISRDKTGSETSVIPLMNIDSESYILDIGPETAKHYSEIINQSHMVVWNGPMGMFETDSFARGTAEIVRSMSKTGAYSIIGGGDTIAAFNKFGNIQDADFVSTGGGAMLEFLSGNKLPGLSALDYYD